jgi:hypothetical protein
MTHAVPLPGRDRPVTPRVTAGAIGAVPPQDAAR